MSLLRRPLSKTLLLRRFSTAHTVATTTSETMSSLRNHHEFLPPSTYINSWKPPRNPKEAATQMDFLRRDYSRKVNQMRKVYIEEMELQRAEKLRKDEARKEALRITNEERKAAKDAKKKAESIERQAAEEEFRKMLAKERLEKLEYWKMRQRKIEERKKEMKELVRRKSSMWIEESDLVKTAMEKSIDTSGL
ncbi:uncharacterized protein [Primulina huaijiensis]|uniref:uncharacterized protein n=1 Tax=Primulina huaijiensis TaxID=1492673 RepID=UPI003CC79608